MEIENKFCNWVRFIIKNLPSQLSFLWIALQTDLEKGTPYFLVIIR
jgi:hypothetical protein